MSDNQQNYTKGFLMGALVGSAVGAITALLLAPKSGKELRQDIATKTSDIYGKASDYYGIVEDKVSGVVSAAAQDGKAKAQQIINAAKDQASNIIGKAEDILAGAKYKVGETKSDISSKYGNVKDAARAGIDTFKTELKRENEE